MPGSCGENATCAPISVDQRFDFESRSYLVMELVFPSGMIVWPNAPSPPPTPFPFLLLFLLSLGPLNVAPEFN
jgi:hypothetical protein